MRRSPRSLRSSRRRETVCAALWRACVRVYGCPERPNALAMLHLVNGEGDFAREVQDYFFGRVARRPFSRAHVFGYECHTEGNGIAARVLSRLRDQAARRVPRSYHDIKRRSTLTFRWDRLVVGALWLDAATRAEGF